MDEASRLRDYLQSQMPAALGMLHEMVGINSFTANRDGVNALGRFTAECFETLGFSAEFVPSANPRFGDHLVLTRKGRSERSVAMISHLDTVYPPEEEALNDFRWQVDGDRIYGPGTNDIKGGTVLMWLVLTALHHSDPELFSEITWKLLWNSSEEETSPDFGDVCLSHFDKRTQAALVFESEGRSGTDPLVVVARKGRATWRATVTGRGAHAGSLHPRGANAIVQLGRIVDRIAALTDHARGITFNVGTISGGTVLNRVPHEAWAEGEFRAFTTDAYAEGKAALLALAGAGDVSSEFDQYACQVKVEVLAESEPWPRNAATDRLATIWREAGESLGMKIGSERRGGLSDGNLIWSAVPTLDGLGPWGDFAHCSERAPDGSKLPEYVEVSRFVPKALLNAEAIRRLVRDGAA